MSVAGLEVFMFSTIRWDSFVISGNSWRPCFPFPLSHEVLGLPVQLLICQHAQQVVQKLRKAETPQKLVSRMILDSH